MQREIGSVRVNFEIEKNSHNHEFETLTSNIHQLERNVLKPANTHEEKISVPMVFLTMQENLERTRVDIIKKLGFPV